MHVLRVVRVLLPVLIVAALVFAGSSVLSARPDLQNAKSNVEDSWSTLAVKLDQRYKLLATANDKLRPIPGPIHSLVGDTDTTLARWRDERIHGGVAAQVNAANDLEGLSRRLIATAAASPRVSQNTAVLPAIAAFQSNAAPKGAKDFNTNVVIYEHERRGPVRALVASVLGDREIPVLDTTETPVSATATSS
jgi:hypothetical protein